MTVSERRWRKAYSYYMINLNVQTAAPASVFAIYPGRALGSWGGRRELSYVGFWQMSVISIRTLAVLRKYMTRQLLLTLYFFFPSDFKYIKNINQTCPQTTLHSLFTNCRMWDLCILESIPFYHSPTRGESFRSRAKARSQIPWL